MNKFKNIKGHIFDIGANDGSDGLAIAIRNKNFFVHAFEPNPYLIPKIKKLKKKIEQRKGIIIKNYKIYNFAISDKIKKDYFYISINDKVSSLNKFSKNLDVSWPGYKNTIFKTVKKIKVRIRTLEDFIEKNKINLIRYIHIDTQGNDLKVLKGLKSKINIIQEGKMEAAINKKNAAYINNHTINDVKKFFSKTKLKIFKIIKIKHISDKKIIKNEADIYFINKNFNKINRINLKYNLRYFGRLIYNNTYIKDDILDFFEKLKNKILN